MVPDTSPMTAVEESKTDNSSSTPINALIGAVIGVIFSFIPFSPIFGGAIAGYLEGGTTNDGMRVGAFAGLIMLIPIGFIGMFIMMWMLGMLGFGGAPVVFIVIAAIMLVFGAIYTVGLSAVGGYLGIYLKDEL